MELRQSLEGDDLADIRAKTEALTEASHKLAEAVYAKASKQQGGGPQQGPGDGGQQPGGHLSGRGSCVPRRWRALCGRPRSVTRSAIMATNSGSVPTVGAR